MRPWVAVLGVILAASAVTACGGGGESETLQINSGAPSRLPRLETAFEHKVRKRNHVSDLSCQDDQEPDVEAGGEVWDCELTMSRTGIRLEIEALVSVSTGDYTVLECRRGPNQKYSQTPRGICKRIH